MAEVDSYSNNRDKNRLPTLTKVAGAPEYKMESVISGAPEIIFKERKLSINELKKSRKCKFNLRDTSKLNAAAVKDIANDMKDSESNKSHAFGYIENGIIYILAGNRRKETIILNGKGSLKILVTEKISDEDKVALSKSFDVYIAPGPADMATTFKNLIDDSNAKLEAKQITRDELITQAKISNMYNLDSGTVSTICRATPIVESIDNFFPIKSLITLRFLKLLLGGGKQSIQQTISLISAKSAEIEKYSNSKKDLIESDPNYSAEDCTRDIQGLILSICKNKKGDKPEPDLSEFEKFDVKRKGVKIQRKPNGNISINLNYDSQSNEVVELIKKLAGDS